MEGIRMQLYWSIARFTLVRLIWITFFLYVLCLVTIVPAFSVAAIPDSNSTNADHVRELFERRCTGCHSLDGDKEGPRLRGVYGRKSGTVPTFKYSDALKKADVTWDETSLDKWLTDPDKFIADADMDFHLEKPDERSAVIAYLKQLPSK
jgi:cytochrome c